MTRTRIKICGITREQDLEAAVDAGADALGFVFYPPSPRYVSPQRAAELLARVPAFVKTVGLFRQRARSEVKAVLAQVPLDLLQFHGDENAVYCEAFRRPWIKAARVMAGARFVRIRRSFAWCPGSYGHAAGCPCRGLWRRRQTFDWSLIPPSLPLP
jgi:phosphoribosylanthranilate isomerase